MTDATEQLRALAAASLFPTEGQLRLPGLRAAAQIRRDAWGVPYVRAASLDDLWFVQGAVTAGERLFQIDLTLRAANGRLSELFGERTFEQDRFVRVIGMRRAATRQAAAWDAQSRAMHARFREGVAAWIAAMPSPPIEYTLLDVAPELPDDEGSWAAAFVYVAWSLSGNWDVELLRAAIADRLGPAAVDGLLPPVGQGTARAGLGSNAWAVAGSATASGRPLLANDPHLPISQPGTWLPLHLSAPGYEARGVAFTFTPGIVVGTTAHHAWGFTNVSGDVQDLYLERLDETGRSARHGDAWEPLATRTERIAVRGEPEARTVEVRESRHGPILQHRVLGLVDPAYVPMGPTETYALRWMGAERTVVPSFVLRLADAVDLDGFREAAHGLECPGQNVVYADVDGHIGLQRTGAFPVRRAGDGAAPVPGWTDEHEWEGEVPRSALLSRIDPEEGFVVSANDPGNDPGSPGPPELPLGVDFHHPFRAARIAELLGARGNHDVDSMRAIQLDTVSLPARRTLPSLVATSPAGPRGRRALEVLAAWDGDVTADSAGGAIYNVWCRHLARRALVPELGEDLFAWYHAFREPFQCAVLPELLRTARPELVALALEDALDELDAAQGAHPTAWAWGATHRLRPIHPLASIPGLGPLFVTFDAPFGGDEQTVSQAGFDGRSGYEATVVASWRAVWDLGDLDRSVGVVPTGVSGNPASPHWGDQSALYLTGAAVPAPFSRAAVEAATVGLLELVPG